MTTTTTTTPTSHVSTVTRIGAGERLSEVATDQILATVPDGFDAGKRGAVTALVIAWACPDGNVPPQKTGGKGAQKATDFGRGVDALTKRVKSALAPEKATDYLALVRQAATTAANKGNHSAEAIAAAVAEALSSLTEGADAA